MPHPVSIAPKPKVFTSDPLSAGPAKKCTLDIDQVENWVWWCARNVHQGILDDRPTIPTMARYSHGLGILKYERVLVFYPIVTTPNDLFFIIWECSYRQQSQRRKQRLQWHTPLHRLRCNFNLIWFWKIIGFSDRRKNKVIWEIFFDIYYFLHFFYLWRMSTRLPSSGIMELSTIPMCLKKVKTILMLRNI